MLRKYCLEFANRTRIPQTQQSIVLLIILADINQM